MDSRIVSTTYHLSEHQLQDSLLAVWPEKEKKSHENNRFVSQLNIKRNIF